MRKALVRDVAIGFIAAAIIVLTVHQLMYIAVTALGLAKIEAWSLRGIAPFNVPATINAVFWGGLWGALFALIWEKLPGTAMWLKGLIYGLMIVVVSNWLFLPLIKGQIFGVPNQALFAGGDPKRLLAGALILGVFGLTTGLLYGLLTKRSNVKAA